MRRFTPILLLTTVALAPALRAGAQEALLIQDHYPWGADAWQSELVDAGISYTEIDSADVASTDLAGYAMVITSSDQDSTYNTNIMASFSEFEDYVTQGGVLVWSACTQSNDTPYPDPPFGGTNVYDGLSYADVADPSHPMAANVPDPAYGTGVAHNYIDGEPVSADIVMTSQDTGEPVLYVLDSGSGTLIVSTLTWEYGWVNDQDNKQTLINAVNWGWTQISCDEDGDGYDDPACGGADCDDDDADVYPGADEYCNGYDDDCDGDIDEDDAVDALDWWYDGDADGFGDASIDDVACDQPTGYVANDDDCDDSDAGINPDAAEIRNAIDEDCDEFIDEGLLEVGDLIVTEIMKDPTVVADEYGEWFEVFNLSAWAINLLGGTIYDLDGDGFTVSSDLWIAPGAHAVLARNGDAGLNGGVTADYAYGSWPLANNTDEVELEHFGTVLDTVVYADADGWPDQSGESMALDPDTYGESLNDDAANWCGSQDMYGQGDKGTPGAVNLDCCPDQDGDGYQDEACGGLDCDDSDPAVFPGASEDCNGIDDDCDDEIDEGLPTTVWYPDADGDGYGDASATPVVDCQVLADHVDNHQDCDDGNAAINPAATEMCDGEDNDCDGTVDEADAADAATWYEDADGDTYGNVAAPLQACDQPPGYVANVLDCDDGDATQYPGADELCNGEDDDCDGDVDEGGLDAQTWYEDADGDGFGNAAVSDVACTPPQGFVDDDTDCDDGNANHYPGADELCNGEDDDCDGDVDEPDAVDALTWYADLDGDGFGDPAITQPACDQPQDFVDNADDCDPADPAQYPGADELCNGEDDDCDGDVDEDDALDVLTWYADLDGDGFGDPAITQEACDAPPDFVDNADDCDPADPDQYPGADELCNGEDDDCDGDIDEDDAIDALTWFVDQDGDGFGSNAVVELDCDPPLGFVDNDLDCDDADPAVNPAAEEVCNGIDDDCDAMTDELVDGDGDGFTICDGDCDELDAAVNPDAEEVCDGIDNDCDPATDEEVDGDGDGVSLCQDDCDDTEPAMFPGNPEVCDLLDNDCDGVLPDDEIDDDGDGMTECEGDCDDADVLTYDGAPEQCDQIDNDCDGVVDNGADEDLDGDGFNACQGDCDNNDPNVYPLAPEICDGKDDDCDGDLPLDELDEDGDGWIVCAGDCDDTDADLNLDDVDGDGWTTCDGDCDDDHTDLNLDDVDGDGWTTCDGDCDDDDAALDPADNDGDGWSTCDGDCDDTDGSLELDDVDGDGWTTCDDDCDDDDATVFPGSAEECDGIDNDCDGVTDDVDADGDGHPAEDCGGDDCDDSDGMINPDEPEICDDGIDNDCDGETDFFDVECEDSGDDDDDDDDDDTPDDCQCRSSQAGSSSAALPALLTAALALLVIRRRNR